MSDKLEFTNAPIIELVCGAQFEGEVFKNQLVYELYHEIKDTFPIIQQNPPLPSIIEKIDSPSVNRVLQGFNTRTFFINEANNKLIQIQPDRILFNWRKTNDKEEYPHFAIVFKEFYEIYKKLVKSSKIEESLNQLEVTYVDHIFLEDFNRSDYNPDGILRLYKLNRPLKSINSTLSIPVNNLVGNIIINLKSALRNSDNKKLLALESTCRGINIDISFERWFELAHIELLELFKNITTDNAKKIWGIK